MARVLLSAGLMAGYKGFGSFHSDNVEEMLAAPDDAYVAPPPLIPFDDAVRDAASGVELGRAFARHFLLDLATWTFVNHGAFGGSLTLMLDLAERWRRECERQPLLFIDRLLFPQLVVSIRKIARFVGVDRRELVFVANATTGINAVLRSLALTPADCVFMLDIAYGSVKKLATHVTATCAATVVTTTVRVSALTSSDDIVRIVAESLPANAKLAIFDHVTSNTGIVLPVAELTAVCHARGTRVLIDGAHALGMLDLNIASVGADYYVSNLHKWMCGCKGSAILYVKQELQSGIVPPIISHGFGSGFCSSFVWDGCRDYSAVLIVPALLSFWEAVGWARVRTYCGQLCRDACNRLCEAWRSSLMTVPSLYANMALVRIPDAVTAKLLELHGPGPVSSLHAKVLQDYLHYSHHVEVPIKFLEDQLFIRISAAPYNELADYDKVAEAVLAYASSA